MKVHLFSIVVIGGMNPTIHHPSWYRLVELLSDDEVEAITTGAEPVVVTPQFSRFAGPDFELICRQDRWEIQTKNELWQQRSCAIAGQVFDHLLKHTMVSALGLNFHFTGDVEGALDALVGAASALPF
ncbi:MAG: hypothetical protein J5I93_23575 [Pirellulaceae bacterium]|nr:hypothetical protein [Pirellulaceae bacterium]